MSTSRERSLSAEKDPSRRSKHGWYAAILVYRFEYYDEDTRNPNRRCEVHENTCLIRARAPNKAYDKAKHLGQASDGIECVDEQKRRGVWRFVGIAELLPVYEKIEDGCEILWTKYYCAVKTAERKVKNKDELQVFKQAESEST